MKRFFRCVLGGILAFGMFSCSSSYKNVPYLLNSEEVMKSIEQNANLYDACIQPKDLLSIIVSNPTNEEAATPFNLTVPTSYNTSSRNSTSQPVIQTYLVDNNGNVEFPILGTLHLGGLTKSESETLIKEKLKTHLKNPIVNVRLTNYKISVIGEVARPGTFTISNEKVNIFEALALAGDLTIYGKRDCIKLIRENDKGEKLIETLNLNDAKIITSPYYYLQQNDVVYVEPNKAKAKNSDIGNMTTLWFSAVSIVISLTSLLYNILK